MARRAWRRPRRSTVVFVQAVLAVIACGVATTSVPGYVVAGTAGVVGIAGLVRRRGRGLGDVLHDRLRDAPGPGTGPGDPPADGARRDLGAPLRLLPHLHVAEIDTRRSGRLGVAGDGQGFAVVLDAEVSAHRSWEFSAVVEHALGDPSRPAAVQLIIEQRSGRRTAGGSGFAPGRTYASLPTGGIPLWTRALIVLRHEPSWAPETVAARGGGAAGARAALAAAATRLVAASGRDGLVLRTLDGARVAALFRELGDPGPDCETREDAWTTSTACHGVVSVAVEDASSVSGLLAATAGLDVDRCVVSVAVSAVDHTVCGALRLVGPDLDHVQAAVDQLVDDGLAARLPRLQEPGVVATLPLGGGARSLAALVNQVRA